MRVLIAEDDSVSRKILESILVKWGYEVVSTHDGNEAWERLKTTDAPPLVILDWMMPGRDGVEVCRLVRENGSSNPPQYIILLTAKADKEDIVTGLKAGADDYITKPFDHRELLARVEVGRRMVELQNALAQRVKELEEALSKVKQLQGLLPICCYCKKIRNDKNYWQHLEQYISMHSEAEFSHGICPDCLDKATRELDGLTVQGNKKVET